MYTDAFGLNAWPDFHGSVYIAAADSLHVAEDVTTNTDTRTRAHTYSGEYVRTR